MKNTHGTEPALAASFWLFHDSGVGFVDTKTKYAIGVTGRNGTEVTIPDFKTPPVTIST